MTVYTNIFGGSNIAPADFSYSAVTLTDAITYFSWPVEASTGTNLLAGIMDVSQSSASRQLRLPSAMEVSTGTAILFNNTGAYTYTVNDSTGTQLLSSAVGTTYRRKLPVDSARPLPTQPQRRLSQARIRRLD